MEKPCVISEVSREEDTGVTPPNECFNSTEVLKYSRKRNEAERNKKDNKGSTSSTEHNKIGAHIISFDLNGNNPNAQM